MLTGSTRIALLLSSFGFAQGAFAQAGAGFGSISGTVVDPSGAAVANAKVTVTNESKGIRRALTANGAGIFNAPALTPAAGYDISVEMPGFSFLERKDIEIKVG